MKTRKYNVYAEDAIAEAPSWPTGCHPSGVFCTLAKQCKTREMPNVCMEDIVGPINQMDNTGDPKRPH